MGSFCLPANGARWAEAARCVAACRGIRLATHVVGGDIIDETGGLPARVGLTTDGALLVRPDGFVAWRTS